MYQLSDFRAISKDEMREHYSAAKTDGADYLVTFDTGNALELCPVRAEHQLEDLAQILDRINIETPVIVASVYDLSKPFDEGTRYDVQDHPGNAPEGFSMAAVDTIRDRQVALRTRAGYESMGWGERFLHKIHGMAPEKPAPLVFD